MLNWAVPTIIFLHCLVTLGFNLTYVFLIIFPKPAHKNPQKGEMENFQPWPCSHEKWPDCGPHKNFKAQNMEVGSRRLGSLSLRMITFHGSLSCFRAAVVGDVDSRESVILCSFDLGDTPFCRIAKRCKLGVCSERYRGNNGKPHSASCICILFISFALAVSSFRTKSK